MADIPKSVSKVAPGLTLAGDVYVQGDQLPVPEVEEKNTDSVWALWSDLVEKSPKSGPAAEEDDVSRDRDFLETVPMDLNAMAEAHRASRPELPKK